MDELAIIHGKVLTPFVTIENGVVLVRDSQIISIGEISNVEIPATFKVIDARGLIVAPGFIDAQTHGGNSYDYMTASPDQVGSMLLWLASTGVTAVLPTLSTSSQEDLLVKVKALDEIRKTNPPGAEIIGIHLEGPYISLKKRGAQPEQPIRPPSISEIEAIISASSQSIKLVTLAPELPGAIELIRFLSSQGVIASIGHSDATYEQVEQAEKVGLRRAAHLFNGMSEFNHRSPGAVGAVLTNDNIYAEIILDGHHVHPAAARLALRSKGLHRLVLVTDASQAAGLGDGVYIRPGNRKVIVENGAVRLESGALAGSALTMSQAVANAAKFLGIPLADAIAMASAIAAESLGLQDSRGSLAPGKLADLVIMDENVQILMTIARGRIAFQQGQSGLSAHY